MTLPGALGALGRRLRALLKRDALDAGLDAGLDEELRFHLDRLASVHERAGTSVDPAVALRSE